MEVTMDAKTIEAEPASTSERSVGDVTAYIDPVKEATMMRKFDVRYLNLFLTGHQLGLCFGY
jgi:hypothetical protein